MHIKFPWNKKKQLEADTELDFFHDGRITGIIIIVIGRSGAGKSTFVNAVLGCEQMLVGHTLTSCTENIQWGVIESIPNHPLLADQRLVIVDTPGFEEADHNDVDTFQKVSRWLEHSYSHEMRISGIVYIHDISPDRFTQHDLKNLKIFETICGDIALRRVMLTITKSEKVREVVDSRENALRELHWAHWISNGAQVMRFDFPGSINGFEAARGSPAWAVIDQLISTLIQGEVLLLQRELVDYQLPLSQTSAAKHIVQQIQEGLEKLNEAMVNYSNVAPKSPHGNNERLQQLLEYEERLRNSIKELKPNYSFRSRLFSKLTGKPS